MRNPAAAGHHRRFSVHVAAAAGALFLVAATASAQAEIKVSDTTSFKLGVLFQPQADWTQDATGGYDQNLFLRRARVLLGGQLARNVTFFVETDNANLGKVVGTAKEISTGFTLQDAFVEWKVADEFILGAGLMFIPLCRNCYESAGTLLPIDYGASSFLESGPTQSVVSRDTGFQPAATWRTTGWSTGSARSRERETACRGTPSGRRATSNMRSSTPNPASSPAGPTSARRRSSPSAAATTFNRTTRPSPGTRSSTGPSAPRGRSRCRPTSFITTAGGPSPCRGRTICSSRAGTSSPKPGSCPG